jgi:hypothetical protein
LSGPSVDKRHQKLWRACEQLAAKTHVGTETGHDAEIKLARAHLGYHDVAVSVDDAHRYVGVFLLEPGQRRSQGAPRHGRREAHEHMAIQALAKVPDG